MTATTALRTALFHGRDMPLTAVLQSLASQEHCDGDAGNAMQAAADELRRMQRALNEAVAREKAIRDAAYREGLAEGMRRAEAWKRVATDMRRAIDDLVKALPRTDLTFLEDNT